MARRVSKDGQKCEELRRSIVFLSREHVYDIFFSANYPVRAKGKPTSTVKETFQVLLLYLKEPRLQGGPSREMTFLFFGC